LKKVLKQHNQLKDILKKKNDNDARAKAQSMQFIEGILGDYQRSAEISTGGMGKKSHRRKGIKRNKKTHRRRK